MESQTRELWHGSVEAGEDALKFRGQLTTAIEVLLVVLLSIGATYSFSSSSAFAALEGLVSTVYPFLVPYLTLVIAALLSFSGLALVVVRRKPSVGLFVLLIAVFCAPSVLAYSSVAEGWLRVLGAESAVQTEATFPSMMAICLFVAASYLALRYTSWFRESGRELAGRGVTAEDVEEVYGHQHKWLLLVLLGAVVGAVLVTLFARALTGTLARHAAGMPLELVVLGILCSLAIAGVAYWLVLHIRSSGVSEEEGQQAVRLYSGFSLGEAGKLEEANEAFRQVVELAKATGSRQDRGSAATAALFLALNLDQAKKTEEASKARQQAIELGIASEAPEGREIAAWALVNLAFNLQKAGDLKQANEAYQRAIDVGKASGTREGQKVAAGAALNLGLNLQRAGRSEEANKLYQAATWLGKASATPEGEDIARRAAGEFRL